MITFQYIFSITKSGTKLRPKEKKILCGIALVEFSLFSLSVLWFLFSLFLSNSTPTCFYAALLYYFIFLLEFIRHLHFSLLLFSVVLLYHFFLSPLQAIDIALASFHNSSLPKFFLLFLPLLLWSPSFLYISSFVPSFLWFTFRVMKFWNSFRWFSFPSYTICF